MMTARLALAVLVAAVICAGEAQAQATDLTPVCDGKFGLCRYVDKATRQEMIPPHYERAMPFSEGLAAVRMNGRFGYIDTQGRIVIEPRFDLAGAFHQGLAEILVGENTGVIDRNGSIVVPPRFARAVPWTRDVILAIEGRWPGAYPQDAELPSLKEGGPGRGLIGLYHVGGHWVREPEFESVTLFERDGGAPIWASPRNAARQFGLLAPDGHWLVEPRFERPGPLVDGRAIVRKRDGRRQLSGTVGPGGEIVMPLQALDLSYRRNGWQVAREPGSNRQGFVDDAGQLVGGRYFEAVRTPEPSHGDIASVRIGDLWKGLDRGGNIVPHPDNGRVAVRCPQGLRAVWVDGKHQLVDANGRPTIPYLLDWIGRDDCSRPLTVRFGDKQGFVATDGKLLFDPPVFESQYLFGAGHAVVRHNGKWGVIDTTGRWVLPARFDERKGARNGIFGFVLDGREIWLTASGEERSPPQPERPAPRPEMLDCGQGLKLFAREGQWGIAEADGRAVIVPRYRALSCFYNGVAWAPIEARHAWCAIGPDGAERANQRCLPFFYPVWLMHHRHEKLHDDPFESSVLWSRAWLEFHDGKRNDPPGLVGDHPADAARGGIQP